VGGPFDGRQSWLHVAREELMDVVILPITTSLITFSQPGTREEELNANKAVYELDGRWPELRYRYLGAFSMSSLRRSYWPCARSN
jgi:hypothetical protein